MTAFDTMRAAAVKAGVDRLPPEIMRQVEMKALAGATAADLADRLSDLAVALTDMRFDEQAFEYCKRSRRANDRQIAALSNGALCLMRLGRYKEALSWAWDCERLASDHPEIRFTCAIEFLRNGLFGKGWPLYRGGAERRFKTEAMRHWMAALPEFTPSGDFTMESFKDRKIALWCDQGLGDQIMHMGFVPEIVRAGAEVKLFCEPRLVPLAFGAFGIEVASYTTFPSFPDFDSQLCLADAGGMLRPTMNSFSARAGAAYLMSDWSKAAALAKDYAKFGGGRPLVGIAWRSIDTKDADEKSIPLALWQDILRERDVCFVALQYKGAEEAQAAKARSGAWMVIDPRIDPWSDLAGLAAQITACDLVIATSNVTAHLAGSLGIPTLVLLPTGRGLQWHWFLERTDSPWYASVTLSRQRKPGDWSRPLAAALTRVKLLIAEKGRK